MTYDEGTDKTKIYRIPYIKSKLVNLKQRGSKRYKYILEPLNLYLHLYELKPTPPTPIASSSIENFI